jgi:hypothetical protein
MPRGPELSTLSTQSSEIGRRGELATVHDPSLNIGVDLFSR